MQQAEMTLLRETALEHFEQTPAVEVDDLTLDDVSLYTTDDGVPLAVAPDGTGAELAISEDGVTATPAIVDVEDKAVEPITVTEQRDKPAVDKLSEEALRDPSRYD